MQHFSRLFPRREDSELPQTVPADPSLVTGPSDDTFMPTQSGALSRGVLIKGSVKFLNGMFIDGKLPMLFRRFVLFAGNSGRNRNYEEVGPKFEWPYVMNSSVAMRGPPVSGTWIWHRQHAGWHHGYYRTHR
jgi:hypothetical protein